MRVHERPGRGPESVKVEGKSPFFGLKKGLFSRSGRPQTPKVPLFRTFRVGLGQRVGLGTLKSGGSDANHPVEGARAVARRAQGGKSALFLVVFGRFARIAWEGTP